MSIPSVNGSAVLELESVTLRVGDGPLAREVLSQVSLSVCPGELVAVMGPSGSGKSTLLNLAGGLDVPTSGVVRVQGHEVSTTKTAARAALRRRYIGYVFQDLNLIPTLNAVENVMLPLELDGVRTRTARSQALAALESVGLSSEASSFPDELSGGQQQRIAIARALVGDRGVVLADEPTGALDSATGEAVLALIRRRCDEGVAVLLVTHEARHAAWADRIVLLRDGRVVEQVQAYDRPESLLRSDL